MASAVTRSFGPWIVAAKSRFGGKSIGKNPYVWMSSRENKRPSVAAGIKIGTGIPSGSPSFNTASKVLNRLRSGSLGPWSWTSISNSGFVAAPAIAVNSAKSCSGWKLGSIRQSRSTGTSPGTTLTCSPPRIIVGLTVFRNNGLKVRPLLPSSFRVAAVKRGFNKVFMARRGAGGRFLPMAWNMSRVSGVTWVGSWCDSIRFRNRAKAFTGLSRWFSEPCPPPPRKVTLTWHTRFSATMIG